MTSVPSRRQLLSGNKRLGLVGLFALLIAACSPKVRQAPPKPVAVPPPAKAIEKPVNKPQVKLPPPVQKFSNIAMLLPFNLDNLEPGKRYSAADQKKANMALDYYQGFKLALDSLTAEGHNYRLQLFDSRDQPAEAHALAANPKIRNSDLIVGPIFPDGVKAFSATASPKPELSPLSPASPAGVNHPSLITAIPPLEYHALRSAEYVYRRLKAKKVFVLKSGFSVDNNYTVPFKRSLDTLSKLKVKTIQLTVVRGNLNSLLPQLSKTEPNVFVIPSTNQGFLQVTLRSLDSLSKNYPVILIGHPSWERMSFLRAEQLQRLRTVITSADHVNYKAGNTKEFIHEFRKAFHSEPSEYAVKGFDEGLYFGKLLAENESFKPEQHDFDGIHNSFHFIHKGQQGWINTHVSILKYVNFELKAIE